METMGSLSTEMWMVGCYRRKAAEHNTFYEQFLLVVLYF